MVLRTVTEEAVLQGITGNIREEQDSSSKGQQLVSLCLMAVHIISYLA
jgi:hypothetical protein